MINVISDDDGLGCFLSNNIQWMREAQKYCYKNFLYWKTLNQSDSSSYFINYWTIRIKNL